jgi:molybdopterin molybdotransferase
MMISFPEAQQLVIGQARSFGKEKVYLDNAIGRVVAERIVADRDYPPFNRAAMDGYAIRHSDWEAGLRSFIIRETIFAGSISQSNIEKGECYRIMTGAAVPECADTVIRREDVLEKLDAIECLLESVNIYQHIAKRGEDLKKDESLSSAAVMCSPAITGLLASIGKNEVLVERLPKVAIITTGDEVVNVDQPVNSVQIRNSNSHLLKAFLKKWNIVVNSCVHVQDQVDKIESTLTAALSVDIIIICGGVSAGDADHVPRVLDHLGAKKIFHKVAIKPGKPIWFGKFDNGPTVFALPGNPLSCMVTFKLFIEFFLSYSFSLGEPQQLSLRLNGSRSKKSQLDEFFPVQIIGAPSQFEIVPFNGSGDITAAIQADAIARHPVATTELLSGIVLHAYPLF